jgi:hypothetical protein
MGSRESAVLGDAPRVTGLVGRNAARQRLDDHVDLRGWSASIRSADDREIGAHGR